MPTAPRLLLRGLFTHRRSLQQPPQQALTQQALRFYAQPVRQSTPSAHPESYTAKLEGGEQRHDERHGTAMSPLDKAAQYLFMTEIMRGLMLTVEQVFKPPHTIMYPFEKGPLSPRFRGEHALRRYPSGKCASVGCVVVCECRLLSHTLTHTLSLDGLTLDG